MFYALQGNGSDRMEFLCDKDFQGEDVPSTWADAVKNLRKNYATDVVIRALGELLQRAIVIVTVHGVSNFVLLSSTSCVLYNQGPF